MVTYKSVTGISQVFHPYVYAGRTVCKHTSRHIHQNVHSTTIHQSEKLEIILMSFHNHMENKKRHIHRMIKTISW